VGVFISHPECRKRNGPGMGGAEAVWVLRETTDGLWLPLQPTTSNSGALLTFAHRPDFKARRVKFYQWPLRRPQYPPPPNNSTNTTIISINSIGSLL